MLSTTYTVDDVKEELEIYEVYGYDTDYDFETDISKAATNAMYKWMFKYLSRSTYENLKYLDRNYFEDSTVDITDNDKTVTMDSTTNLVEDMYLSGYGIPDGCQVDSIANSTEFEITNYATETATNVTILFSELSEEELNIYYAELNFIRYEFFEIWARKQLFKRKAARESISENQVTRTTSGPIGSKMAAREYLRLAKWYMANAGYKAPLQLQRGDSFFYKQVRE